MSAKTKFIIIILLLSSIFVPCNSQCVQEYTNGSMQVEYVVTALDNYGSQKACATLVAGFDPTTYNYNTSCFTRTLNEHQIFTQCEVAFNNILCNSCLRCDTTTQQVGYNLDCTNIQPRVNTNNQCVLFTNTSLEEILVGPDFTVPFNFRSVPLSCGPSTVPSPTAMDEPTSLIGGPSTVTPPSVEQPTSPITLGGNLPPHAPSPLLPPALTPLLPPAKAPSSSSADASSVSCRYSLLLIASTMSICLLL